MGSPFLDCLINKFYFICQAIRGCHPYVLRDNTRVRIFYTICRTKREIFIQNLTLGYMTKL
jgi:hypothetical protein